MLKVVIIGYGEMFTNLVAGTLDANCEIVGVLRRDTIKYHPVMKLLRDTVNPSVEYNYIKSYNLPELYVKSVNSDQFKKQLLKLNPNIILVGSWPEKIEKQIYDIPKIASINAHPSLLPKYRGPNPYFWNIKNMEKTTGITFHIIDKNFDTGAILAQEEIKIFPADTGKSLKERTVLTARGVACELLKALREDIIIPLTQREEKASYYSQPENYGLDFSKTAEENAAIIRAIYPWDKAYLYDNTTCLTVIPDGIDIQDNNSEFNQYGTITSVDSENKTISVLCGDNKILTFQMDHFNWYDRPFIKNYIKRELYIGKVL